MRPGFIGGGALAAVVLVSGLFVGHEVMADGDQPAAEQTVSRIVSTSGFTYQGRLETGGVPVDGTCDFQFSMWDSATGLTGQIGFTQSATLVVTNGHFQALLSPAGELGGFDGGPRFLETAVTCPTGSASFETLPRQQLTGTPYALGLVLPMAQSGSYLANGLSVTNTNVGALGYAALRGISEYWGVTGISGAATSPTYQKAGVYGESDHVGVAASGNNYGVSATSVDGIGVAGTHLGGGVNAGIYGTTLSSDPGAVAVVGIQGTGFNPALPVAAGLKGISANGIGVLGHAQFETGIIGTSVTGTGIQGYASAITGNTVGIRGKVDSPDGAGIVAQGAGTGGAGAALEITDGAIKVTGAGFDTATPAFIHTATVGNSASNYTCIDNPLTNGDPGAILLVTQRWQAVYNNHVIGVFYRSGPGADRWCIFNEDSVSAIPAGALFNVLVIKN